MYNLIDDTYGYNGPHTGTIVYWEGLVQMSSEPSVFEITFIPNFTGLHKTISPSICLNKKTLNVFFLNIVCKCIVFLHLIFMLFYC